jgi:hypothetical protein
MLSSILRLGPLRSSNLAHLDIDILCHLSRSSNSNQPSSNLTKTTSKTDWQVTANQIKTNQIKPNQIKTNQPKPTNQNQATKTNQPNQLPVVDGGRPARGLGRRPIQKMFQFLQAFPAPRLASARCHTPAPGADRGCEGLAGESRSLLRVKNPRRAVRPDGRRSGPAWRHRDSHFFLLSMVRRKRNDSVPVSMMCARSVIRSKSALHNRGFGNTVVHSENGRFVVTIIAARSARSEIT